jgi:hypothetical protein
VSSSIVHGEGLRLCQMVFGSGMCHEAVVPPVSDECWERGFGRIHEKLPALRFTVREGKLWYVSRAIWQEENPHSFRFGRYLGATPICPDSVLSIQPPEPTSWLKGPHLTISCIWS